jgi:hypothetical protein
VAGTPELLISRVGVSTILACHGIQWTGCSQAHGLHTRNNWDWSGRIRRITYGHPETSPVRLLHEEAAIGLENHFSKPLRLSENPRLIYRMSSMQHFSVLPSLRGAVVQRQKSQK